MNQASAFKTKHRKFVYQHIIGVVQAVFKQTIERWQTSINR